MDRYDDAEAKAYIMSLFKDGPGMSVSSGSATAKPRTMTLPPPSKNTPLSQSDDNPNYPSLVDLMTKTWLDKKK